ncbi:MAG: diguanylate cyclase [Acidaminococcaceae bacterium]|nr:diguanylate cyclase [Anaerolineaceae bacterium]MBQ6743760.1 diguanylate cyclase [Acidaminococcaceae bacterium]MBQ6778360.1 diguanylate cyclase [Acidaminococcaceae bacterium]
MEDKKRILVIVPPSPLTTEFTEKLSNAFTVLVATSEEEGYQVLNEQTTDIAAVLLDLNLARQSNFSFVDKVSMDKLFTSIPVIALSPELPTLEDMDCLEHGCAELLTPPNEWKLLEKRINNAIRSKDSLSFTEIEKMLKQLPSNIFLKDKEGKYVFATHYWRHVNHADPHWTIRGKTDMDIRKDKGNAKIAMEADKKILATGQGTEYIIEENYEGLQEFLQLIKRPTYDEKGNINGIIALINDVTKQQLLEMELEKRSKTDPLTGLLNKGATEDLIRMMIGNYYKEKDKNLCALMMIDVDNFKTVNDTLGHAKGDKVLTAIGNIIKNTFKGMDVAGRTGGDEFMVFLRDIEKPENAMHLAESIEKNTNRLILNEDIRTFVSVSIGISMFPEHGKTFEELYHAADKALYYAKKHGRAAWKMYTPELEQE